MSLIPLLYSDWWDDWESPSRLLDQNFGLCLRRNDLLNNIRSCPVVRGSYLRPWQELNRQTSGVSTLQADKDKFQVILDVQQFAPNEISVKTVGREIVIEGKHEEKQDEHGSISRQFVRKYLLPENTILEQVSSSLSSDGVLTITAPKKVPQIEGGERVVPIQQTGPHRPEIVQKPATSSAAPAEAEKNAKKGD